MTGHAAEGFATGGASGFTPKPPVASAAVTPRWLRWAA